MSDETFEGPDIAIIGMVGRFPGAPDLATFWRNLRAGTSSIRPLTDPELDEFAGGAHRRNEPNFVPVAAPLDGMKEFDAGFFGYSPREAELLDPQQRIFLECAWEALENAGYDPEGVEGSVGVFAGATASTYLLLNLISHPELARGDGGLQAFVNNTTDSLSTRVSYKLNLRGPSFAVQSACSTSLLSVHLACQSLLNEECDLALAGGISVNLSHRGGYTFVDGSILSPDGGCSPFDANAKGTVFGSGVGVVVLKKLARAVEDGDTIHAVIRGSAVSNDGKLKVGFTAPSVDGQTAAITEAIALSGLEAGDLDYLEAHGTGTSLGDPIEIEALTRAFRTSTDKTGFCAIGSVKGAIGHLDVAAGVAGLIKTVLCLENQELPPSIGYAQPNPRIDFARSPVFVNRALTPFVPHGAPMRAGVSSFGMGGTNVHVVLEQAPQRASTTAAARDELIVLSAKTPAALELAALRLIEHLIQQPGLSLGDLAYTLQVGRHGFAYRRALIAKDVAAVVAALRRPALPPSGPAPLVELARTWLSGKPVDFHALHADRSPRRIPLPTYPFERQTYWIAAAQPGDSRVAPVEAPAQKLHPRPLNTAVVPPRSALEREVAELWKRLLGLEEVSVFDNFFEIGGDSLLATQVATQLRARFGAELSLESLLADPTVASTATLIVCNVAEQIDADELGRVVDRARSLSDAELDASLSRGGLS